MAKSLKSFARQQQQKEASEETQETTKTESTTDESTTEEESDETETDESEEIDETETSEEESDDSEEETEDSTETTDTPAPAASALPPGYIGVNAADLKTLQEKAGKWDAHEGEYKTLKSWYQNTIQIGATAKEDISSTTAKGAKNSVYSQPWNAKAQEVAESSK